jgi:hypothetical protein
VVNIGIRGGRICHRIANSHLNRKAVNFVYLEAVAATIDETNCGTERSTTSLVEGLPISS